MPERRAKDSGPRTADGRLTIQNWAGAFTADEIMALCKSLLADFDQRDSLWRELRRIKYGKDPIEIADEFKALQRNTVRVPYAMNTVNQYVDGILHGGIRYRIPPREIGPEATGDAERLSRWLTAYMGRAEQEAPYRQVVRRVCDDGVSYGELAGKVMLSLDNWVNAPQPGDFEDAAKYETAKRRFYGGIARLPTAWRHVRISDFYPLYGDYFMGGMERSWRSEYDLAERYAIYFDTSKSAPRNVKGKYASRGLVSGESAFESVLLSPPITGPETDGGPSPSWQSSGDNTMPSHVAEMLGGRRYGRNRFREVWEFSDEWATYVLISGKLVCRFNHDYGFTPYIHILTRAGSDGGNEETSTGVLRNMRHILPAFQRRLTMNEIATERNAMMYKVLTSSNPESRPPTLPDGKTPAAIQLKAGEVPYLTPGYQLQTAVEQVAPDNTQSLLLYQQLMQEQGVSPQAAGMPGSTSGYDRAQVRQDFKVSRDPFSLAVEQFCAESAWRTLDLLERNAEEDMELYVGQGSRYIGRKQASFYRLNPSKVIDGQRLVIAETNPLQDTDALATLEAGLRAWQGIPNKRGITHRRFLEQFLKIDNSMDEIQEISEEEFVGSEPVRTVLNKKAADDAGITDLYLDALRAVQNKENQAQALATQSSGVMGRGYGGTPGQEPAAPGIGMPAGGPTPPAPPSMNGQGQ